MGAEKKGLTLTSDPLPVDYNTTYTTVLEKNKLSSTHCWMKKPTSSPCTHTTKTMQVEKEKKIYQMYFRLYDFGLKRNPRLLQKPFRTKSPAPLSYHASVNNFFRGIYQCYGNLPQCKYDREVSFGAFSFCSLARSHSRSSDPLFLCGNNSATLIRATQ